MGPQRVPLAGGRWHFQHGPIDLIIGAEGEAPALADVHAAAWQRFETVLTELVAELPLLRMPVGDHCPLQGAIARRMWQACFPYRAGFVTPMAAVAGAVAQEIIASYQRPGITRAWVNNGGDIALHLTPGAQVRIGLWADLARCDPVAAAGPKAGTESGVAATSLNTDAQFSVGSETPVRGVATSGWRGRSFSLGIADSVTVLAADAARADAAATVIANAVNLQDPRIERRPAKALKDDTDLGDRLVTTHVPPLEPELVHTALRAGLARARQLQSAGLIWRTALVCQDRLVTLDHAEPRRLGATAFPMRADHALGAVIA